MTSNLLKGRTALVTGGGLGLGRGIAIELAKAGAQVAVLSRTRAQLDQVVAQIESAGGRARALVADVTDRAAVEAAVAEAERSLGPVSILVNNAGRALPYGPVGVVDPDEWWRSHSIHVRGTLLCASAGAAGHARTPLGLYRQHRIERRHRRRTSTCRRTVSRRPP